ncbi:hypothetical protein [Streptomyces phytophilus]|uniref:hypothetical protein n=1 Tax=Streptomyces phytophilus TaxID=722715 RepID=UPI0015F0E817|nr:hypothetical protein [Streptomyces phytophilus]
MRLRRVATVLGTLASTGALALGLAGSAAAAQGTLVLDGRQYQNPSGCYDSTRWPLRVANNTDQSVVIYNGKDCGGRVVDVVRPGGQSVSEFGGSVYVH